MTVALRPAAAWYTASRSFVARSLMLLVRCYQLTLSPIMGRQCRFHPTCSHYALEVLETHGPVTGSWMALRRLLRCHPWHPGGIDEPPARP